MTKILFGTWKVLDKYLAVKPNPVVDPEFPIKECVDPLGDVNLRRRPFSVKMYAKMKELGPVRARTRRTPPRSANVAIYCACMFLSTLAEIEIIMHQGWEIESWDRGVGEGEVVCRQNPVCR